MRMFEKFEEKRKIGRPRKIVPGQIISVGELISYTEMLAEKVQRLEQENQDMKRCIDNWGARIREARIIPLNNLVREEDEDENGD
jgi:hypothetical protein